MPVYTVETVKNIWHKGWTEKSTSLCFVQLTFNPKVNKPTEVNKLISIPFICSLVEQNLRAIQTGTYENMLLTTGFESAEVPW